MGKKDLQYQSIKQEFDRSHYMGSLVLEHNSFLRKHKIMIPERESFDLAN